MLERTDTPWYPSARLFRQPRVGEWPALFREVAAELEQLVPGAGTAYCVTTPGTTAQGGRGRTDVPGLRFGVLSISGFSR
jgi:hypothetical protein